MENQRIHDGKGVCAAEDRAAHHTTWEQSARSGRSKDPDKPFTIVMPPPSIRPAAHRPRAGRDAADVLIRYRMKGDPTLWVPGTDHASIATEVKIVDAQEGGPDQAGHRPREVPRARVGVEARIRAGASSSWLRKLGVSCDWKHGRFTMDDGLSRAVRETFVNYCRKV